VPEDEPLGSEFDPQNMWAALCRTTRRALEQARCTPDSIRGISATSQRDGAVFLDSAGRELFCGTNRDARGVLGAEDLAQEHGKAIYCLTGRWPLGLSLADCLSWFREHRPDVYARVAHVFMISDWLIYRLCNKVYSEPTNASSSMLFDITQCTWSAELAELHGHAPGICPHCLLPGQVAGQLTSAAAEVLGLPKGIPVVMGAADSQAACLACSAFEDGTTTVIAGTTIPVQMILSSPLLDAEHRLQTGAYVTPGRWVLEGNGGIAGIPYRWFCETFVGPVPASYATLEQEMWEAQPGEVMSTLGPQIADFRELTFPLRSLFVFPFLIGIERPPKRGAFGRAILENVAFAVRGNVDQLIEISGQPVTALNLCGGLAHSSLLSHLVADLCQKPVHVPVVREASSLGVGICAAVGAGAYPDLGSAAAAMVHWEPTVEPESSNARRYKGLYRKWTALVQQARGL
jgi:autoinducer 2 (AI-2) kinase